MISLLIFDEWKREIDVMARYEYDDDADYMADGSRGRCP